MPRSGASASPVGESSSLGPGLLGMTMGRNTPDASSWLAKCVFPPGKAPPADTSFSVHHQSWGSISFNNNQEFPWGRISAFSYTHHIPHHRSEQPHLHTHPVSVFPHTKPRAVRWGPGWGEQRSRYLQLQAERCAPHHNAQSFEI